MHEAYKSVLLLLIILSTYSYILSATYIAYASSAEVDVENYFHVKSKIEPWLYEKIQALKSNGTMKNLSLIIRFVKDQRNTGMQIEELKNYAASLFTDNHNSTVYSICDVLPIVMAKVPVAEAERIAAYEFVESIGDGDRKVYSGLDPL